MPIITLDWESGALLVQQPYPCGGSAVANATCDNVRYRYNLWLASKRGLVWCVTVRYVTMSREAIVCAA